MNNHPFLLTACATLLALVVQVSVLPLFFDSAFKPDLLLILTVFMALRGSLAAGVPLTLLLGVTQDVYSGMYLGLNTCSYLIIFLVIKNTAERVYAGSSLLFIIMVGSATIASMVLNLLLLVMFTHTPGVAYSIIKTIAPHLLINLFAASLIVLFPGFERSQERA